MEEHTNKPGTEENEDYYDDDQAPEEEIYSDIEIDALKDHCEKINIVFHHENVPIFDLDNFGLSIPKGNSEDIAWFDYFIGAKLSKFLEIQFDAFGILPQIAGIYSPTKRSIEAAISTSSSKKLNFTQERILNIGFHSTNSENQPIFLKQSNKETPLSITIGSPSKELMTFNEFRNGNIQSDLNLSIRIDNIDTGSATKSKEKLESLSNALFLQIHRKLHLGLKLVHCSETYSPNPSEFRKRRRISFRDKSKGLTFPAHTYNREAMALYTYAQGADEWPLQQYLAYYQILEFFMTTSYQNEALERIKDELSKENFDFDSDEDEARLGKCINPFIAGKTNEKELLKRLINKHIPEKILKAFFENRPRYSTFFESEYKEVDNKKLDWVNPNKNLYNSISERIYNIRCNIVHTKQEKKPILPFSSQSEKLSADIELISFIALWVLSGHKQKLDT